MQSPSGTSRRAVKISRCICQEQRDHQMQSPGDSPRQAEFPGGFTKPCRTVEYSCEAANLAGRRFPDAFANPSEIAKCSRQVELLARQRSLLGKFANPAGLLNAAARWNLSPGSGISSADLQTFAGLSNAVAKRQSSPSGGGSPMHLRNTAGPPNVITRRQTSPGRVSSSAALAACGRARSCGISRIAGFLQRYSLLKRPCMQGRFC